MRRLTKDDIGKEIKRYDWETTAKLIGIYGEWVWLFDKKYQQYLTLSNDAKWEVVEEKKEACNCFGTSYQNYKAHEPTEIKAPEGYLKSSGIGRPAEPKKEQAKMSNKFVELFTKEYPDRPIGCSHEFNILFQILDEKFKEKD